MKGSWKAVPLTIIITDYWRNRLYMEVFSLFLPNFYYRAQIFQYTLRASPWKFSEKEVLYSCVIFVRRRH